MKSISTSKNRDIKTSALTIDYGSRDIHGISYYITTTWNPYKIREQAINLNGLGVSSDFLIANPAKV